MGKTKKVKASAMKAVGDLAPRETKAEDVTGGAYLKYQLENVQITSYQLG